MRLVLRRLERALMVVEPPGEARVPRVAEIEHRVLLAGEGLVAEQLPGAVGEAPQGDPVHAQAGPHLLPVEAQERRGRRHPVEAMVVVADLKNGPCHRASRGAGKLAVPRAAAQGNPGQAEATRGQRASAGSRSRPSGGRAPGTGWTSPSAKARFPAANHPPARQACSAARPASGPPCASIYLTPGPPAPGGPDSPPPRHPA